MNNVLDNYECDDKMTIDDWMKSSVCGCDDCKKPCSECNPSPARNRDNLIKDAFDSGFNAAMAKVTETAEALENKYAGDIFDLMSCYKNQALRELLKEVQK